jgi:hypothetical protein
VPGCEAAQELPAFVRIVAVVDFDACESGVDHVVVGLLPHHAPAGRGHGVGKYGDASGRADQLDGERRLRRIVLHEVPRM